MDEQRSDHGKRIITPTVSTILDDGTIVELVYEQRHHRTMLTQFNAGRWTSLPRLDVAPSMQLVPFSPENNLIKNEVVLLASEPRLYRSEPELISDIQSFIHQYVDLSPTFEKVAAYYVMLSWVYDAFNEVPYLRLRGDYGSGKTRALQTIGSLCYKGFFASGASTVSPLFHTLDAFRGTLLFDEADFRFSDERAEIVKILNNGNMRGMPVLRTMMNRQREFNPRAFQVFGPKIVASRGQYDDKALESRFITEEMGTRPLRRDIPINLPNSFKEEARELRNKLLLYRFHRRHEIKLDADLIDGRLEPRLNQILLPLLSVVADERLRGELRALAFAMQTGFIADRGLSIEAQVLEVLAQLMASSRRPGVPVADVAAALSERYGSEYSWPITNRWIGGILRRRLNVHTYKSHGVYVVPANERAKVDLLCGRYGLHIVADPPLGDVGTSGTS
jgi:hypothetical protein